MKSLLHCAILSLIITSCTTINSTTGSQARIDNHKTIAILPFEVRFDLRNNNRKKFTEKELASVRQFMALELQQHLYNWLKDYSYKKSFTVRIQDIDITDNILTEKQISYLVLYNMPRTEIAKMLGVDAVLTPNVIFAQPHSEAVSLLLGPIDPFDPLNPSNGIFFKDLATQEMKMQVLLTDNYSENSMWTFETKTQNGKFTKQSGYNQTQNILYPLFENIDKTLKKFIRNFPYQKN